MIIYDWVSNYHSLNNIDCWLEYPTNKIMDNDSFQHQNYFENLPNIPTYTSIISSYPSVNHRNHYSNNKNVNIQQTPVQLQSNEQSMINDGTEKIALEEAKNYLIQLKQLFQNYEGSPLSALDECLNFIGQKLNESKDKKKRIRNEQKYLANINKLKRNSGQEYVTRKSVVVASKEIIIRPCCSKNCQDKISLETREQIFKDFWKMANFSKQNFYLKAVVRSKTPKRRRSNTEKRQVYYQYFLTYLNKSVLVCKRFFLDTFNISEGRLARALKQSIPGADFRGRSANSSRKTPETKLAAVREHIICYIDYIKHYERTVRENSHVSKNNCPIINVQRMYKLYTRKCEDESVEVVGISVYRNTVKNDFIMEQKEMIPSDDYCTICDSLKSKILSSHNDDDRNRNESELNSHLIRAGTIQKYVENFV
ncbi:hypothetical protein HUG17_1353 [Dermatophagoides farinae]|uniref:Uncharacterized protein n=1 Tax=Dermatophagoides farinae TaxID=6954 RepID=A0A9D4P9U0_DERFA|nr:hypothetical protein HUG17_1353 [Dermatophagoides farinae]